MPQVASTEALPTGSEPPQNVGELRECITSGRIVLSGRIKQLARYALDNPDVIAFSNTHEIASRVGVNPSTVSRCARALGFDSFAAFRLIFQNFVRQRKLKATVSPERR